MRSGATVPRFSAWSGAAMQRCAASDAVPWPDAVAAEPDGTPVRQAAPLREAAQDEPWPEAVRGEPRRAAVPWVELRTQAVRAFCAPGQMSLRSSRPPKRRGEMLRGEGHAHA